MNADAGLTSEAPVPQDLVGYEVIVALTGGIAAYKVCTLVSRLAQAGAGVTAVMTRAARKFVGELTLQALTRRQVYKSLWDAQQQFDAQHISLTEVADLFVVAPATANILGKVAGGLADDLVSTMVMAADSPVVFAPAMNTRMWSNPIVQDNVARLKRFGYTFIDPGEGWLACRTVGPGRMAEPEQILQSVREMLLRKPPKRRQQ
jgi:phosphopantothenoylcysteine decarboxylase/phosphopantothenate--cysteine ligase